MTFDPSCCYDENWVERLKKIKESPIRVDTSIIVTDKGAVKPQETKVEGVAEPEPQSTPAPDPQPQQNKWEKSKWEWKESEE